MARIFLSYARVDAPTVRQIAAALRAAGHDPWVGEDQILVGDSIPGAIEQALRDADFVVICLSRAAAGPGWVQAERDATLVQQLRASRAKLLPVRLESVEPPSLIAHLEHVDLFGDAAALAIGVDRLVRSIAAHEARVRAAGQKVSELARDDESGPAPHPLDGTPDVHIRNPFYTAGTVPLDCSSYVERACDAELHVALDAHPLVVISGEYGIGKSSLMLRAKARMDGERVPCLLDLTLMRPDSLSAFFKRFYRSVGLTLGLRDDIDWEDIGRKAAQKPIVLLLDEFGQMAPDVAQYFIPALHQLTTTCPEVRAVICLPTGIDEFLSRRGVENPRYARGWRHVHVGPLDDPALDRLLALLPPRAHAAAMAGRRTILVNSGRRPRPVQCLCNGLYEADRGGATVAELEALIQSRRCYE